MRLENPILDIQTVDISDITRTRKVKVQSKYHELLKQLKALENPKKAVKAKFDKSVNRLVFYPLFKKNKMKVKVITGASGRKWQEYSFIKVKG